MIVFLQNIDDDDDDGKIADRFHFSLIEKWEIDEEKQKKTQKKDVGGTLWQCRRKIFL